MTAQILDIVLNSLSNDAIQYFFPGYAREKVAVQQKVTTQKDDGILFSAHYGSGGSRGVKIPENLFTFGCTSDEDVCAPTIKKSPAKKKAKKLSIIQKGKKALSTFVLEPKPMDMEPDARTKAILDEIEAIQERFGVTIEEIEAVLSYRVKLSHLRITKHKTIILEDFDMREVKMDTLTKAVFLLYLKHGEGIRYKDLCDHRRELEDIYMSISGRSDLEGIRKSISDLTDPIMSNSINEKVSKVKKAFRDTVDDRIARFYYIDGKQGAAKSIALDRSLVIWE